MSRYDISDQLDISLRKVKRVLALLSLSGVLATDGRTIQVLDWKRLCAAAHFDPARLGFSVSEDDDLNRNRYRREADQSPHRQW